jgi:hypothetical protein
VLLDVATWGAARAPVFTPAGGTAPVAATAAALRAAGWVVTVVPRGAGPGQVWDELASAPLPRAGAS